MYGFINRAIELLVIRKFGEKTWQDIRDIAGVSGDEPYSILQRYRDSETYDLVAAASKLLNVPAETVLTLFGEFFFEFCVEFGYDRILRSLGATPIQFLESLDALHDHLGNTYAGMTAPSFRCSVDYTGDTSLFYLHYYSHRPGLAPVVVGIVQSAIKGIFDTQIQVDQCQPEADSDSREVRFLVTLNSNELQNRKFGSTTSLTGGNNANKFINKETFSNLVPFHVIIDRKMKILQSGKGIFRLFPESATKNLCDLFECVRPKVELTFANILAHLNTVYVLASKSIAQGSAQKKPLRLKGQMVFQKQTDSIIYIASPSAVDIQDLSDQGLCLSDLALHDASRNLIILSEQFNSDHELSQTLEIMTNSLQAKYRIVDEEKNKTDRLIYSVVPPAIVDDLRHRRKVPSKKFSQVSVMFTGIFGFQVFCATHEPIEIINLLNQFYTAFDNLLDAQVHQNVYKVETIADHYFAVSGCPVEISDHARAIAELALDIKDECDRSHLNTEDLQVTIGINSGEIVAGIIGDRMPRYCLFGDCINVTSRTESHGKKGFINITQPTFDCMQAEVNKVDNITFTFYECVLMKGKPEPMPIWLISRGQTDGELSVNTLVPTLSEPGPKKENIYAHEIPTVKADTQAAFKVTFSDEKRKSNFDDNEIETKVAKTLTRCRCFGQSKNSSKMCLLL